MANTENRLSTLPQDTESLELNSLKDANNTTLNNILDTINGVLSSKPSLNEIQTAEVYLANLKILSERYQSGIKDSMQSDNLDDEYSLYVGTKKRLQLLKTEMRQNMNNGSGTYDPSSDTDPSTRSFKNKKRGGSPLDTMMKGDEGEKLTSGVIGQKSAFYDNARGYGSIEGKFSDSVGFSAEGILAHMIGENTAIAVDVEAGSKQARFLTTLGYEISKTQRIKLTYEHFRRLTDFMFSSGEVSETIAQNSIGATYRLKLDKETLKYLELNGYMSKTSSKELEDKTFYVDTPTLYELYNNKRRIAGGKKQGGSVTLGLEPWKGGELRLTANYESTAFDTRYENNRDVSRFGGKASLTQKINDKTSLEVGVGTSSTESLVTEAKLRYSLPENVSLYISGQNIRRRGDIGGSDSNENIIAAGVQGNIPSWVPIFGDDTEAIAKSAKIYNESRANRKPRPYMPALDMDRNPDALPPLTPKQSKQYNEFLHWVATQPAVKSYTVIALRDQRNDRIVVIDKTILPPTAHPDLMTGDLIVDIVPATGIAGVTRDGAPYINANNFALNSSKNQLIVNTASLAVPPAGTTQTYVVTINEVGGGQTLVTIDVQHGSVRITRVDIQRIGGAPDTSPDAISFADKNNIAPSTVTESAPLTITGINTATPISIAGGAGQYAISTDGGATYSAWTSAPGTVNNGNKVKARVTSSATGLQTVSTVLTVGDKSDSFDVTTASQETAPTVAAPTATKTDTSVTVTNHIADPDGVQNITYYIYSDAAGTTLVNSNVNGAAFTGLTASTNYWVKTTAETKNGNTGVWTLQTSPLLAVTTEAAVDVLAPAAPTGGPTLAAVGGVYYSKLTTSNIIVTAAGVNGAGRIWLNGMDTGVDLADGTSYNYDQPVVEGNNAFSYTIKDAAGNTSAPLVFNVFRDTVVPTVTNLPNWGAGVASGSTTAKTVTMTDNNAFAGSSLVSISASAGSITGFDSSTYGTNKPFNYVAPVNPNGSGPLTVTLTYTIRDAANNLTTQTQTFDVAEAPPLNVAPTANNFIYGIPIGSAAKTFDWKVLSAATDADGDTLTATVQTQGTHGTFAIAGDNVTYTPTAGYVGSDVATLRISDGQGHTVDITVTVNGIDTNLAPTITSLSNFGAGVASGSTTAGKSVTFGDETAWGAGSTVSISADGGATIANITPDMTSYGVKTFDFIAPVNPAGSGPKTITITYTVTDANGVQTQTTQQVDVAEAPNNNPVANDVTRDANFNASETYDLAADISDIETPTGALTIVVDTPPAHTSGPGGSFVWETNTRFKLTADTWYGGSDSFTYHVVDGNGGVSLTKTVTINNLAN